MVARQQHGSVRVNLRLPADMHDIIKRLAEHSETTVAGFVQQSIENMRPAYLQLLGTLDQSDHIETVDQGVNVLEQLREMAMLARAEADRLDAMVTGWQQQIREAGERGSDAGES